MWKRPMQYYCCKNEPTMLKFLVHVFTRLSFWAISRSTWFSHYGDFREHCVRAESGNFIFSSCKPRLKLILGPRQEAGVSDGIFPVRVFLGFFWGAPGGSLGCFCCWFCCFWCCWCYCWCHGLCSFEHVCEFACVFVSFSCVFFVGSFLFFFSFVFVNCFVVCLVLVVCFLSIFLHVMSHCVFVFLSRFLSLSGVFVFVLFHLFYVFYVFLQT